MNMFIEVVTKKGAKMMLNKSQIMVVIDEYGKFCKVVTSDSNHFDVAMSYKELKELL
ncbi:hypothetical protein ACFLRQ_02630 [Bacteroidota bacterium]